MRVWRLVARDGTIIDLDAYDRTLELTVVNRKGRGLVLELDSRELFEVLAETIEKEPRIILGKRVNYDSCISYEACSYYDIVDEVSVKLLSALLTAMRAAEKVVVENVEELLEKLEKMIIELKTEKTKTEVIP